GDALWILTTPTPRFPLLRLLKHKGSGRRSSEPRTAGYSEKMARRGEPLCNMPFAASRSACTPQPALGIGPEKPLPVNKPPRTWPYNGLPAEVPHGVHDRCGGICHRRLTTTNGVVFTESRRRVRAIQ